VKDTTETDKINNVTADLPFLRAAYLFSGLISAAANLYVRAISPIPLSEVFFSGLRDPSAAVGSLTEGIGRFLKYDYLFCFASGSSWVIMSFWDLKRAGKLTAGWVKILGIMGAVTSSCGPGSALALMWAWREEVLAKLEA
jgi:hypothetical protein